MSSKQISKFDGKLPQCYEHLKSWKLIIRGDLFFFYNGFKVEVYDGNPLNLGHEAEYVDVLDNLAHIESSIMYYKNIIAGLTAIINNEK